MIQEAPAPADPDSRAVIAVDDDPHMLRAIQRMLRGFEVISCESASDAIEHVKRGAASVVLSDITMPGMTGLELVRAIREHDPDLPVVLITGTPTLDSATKAIEYGVFRYLQKPFETETLRATIEQASRLYRLARAKRQALNLVGTAGASDRAGLEVRFRRALDSLWIAFQPIVSVSQRSVYGYEALARSADLALPDVSHILDAAERLGALEELGRLVRKKASESMLRAGTDALLFVNLHPRDLDDPVLSDSGSPLSSIAHRVVLEITERASLGGIEDVRARVATLRQLGFRIAIDDLGAGYAGLTSFALLEPEIVKVDMTLTRGIDNSPVKQKLVASLTGVCREMNMTTVVEGVETAEERDTLIGLGCDILQGYLFAKPSSGFPEPAW